MKIFLKILLIASLASTSLANPGSWMPEPQLITSIIVEGDDNGSALIILDGGVPIEYIPVDCRSEGERYYNTLFLNTDKGLGIYALALAAFTSGKKIKLALSCSGSRPLITHMQVF
jgi:hypothetical protein